MIFKVSNKFNYYELILHYTYTCYIGNVCLFCLKCVTYNLIQSSLKSYKLSSKVLVYVSWLTIKILLGESKLLI